MPKRLRRQGQRKAEMPMNARLFGWSCVALSAAGLFSAVRSFAAASPSDGGLSCKVICGWVHIVAHTFGPQAGALFEAVAMAVASAVFGYVGYRLLKDASGRR